MPKTPVKAKLRCKDCESSIVEVLVVKQGKNEGKSYAVCDNGCTSINKQTGKRSKKWIDWMPEQERSPSPPPPLPKKLQAQKKRKQEPDTEEEEEDGSLEMDTTVIALEELKNGQRQMMDEIHTMHQRLITLYSKLPLASQWPSSKPSSTQQKSASEQLNTALSTPEPLPSVKKPLFQIDQDNNNDF